MALGSILARMERMTLKHGAIAMIACGLVWWLAASLSSKMDVQAKEIRSVTEELREHSRDTTYLLQSICINTAQSDNDRARCFPPQRPYPEVR